MAFIKSIFIDCGVYIILAVLCSRTNADDIAINPVDVKNTKEVFLNDNTAYKWTSLEFPNAYPPQKQNLIIKCDSGYAISVAIESLDLDGGSGDFLVIKPGTTLDSDNEGIVFTYILKNKTYLVNSNNAFISLQVFGNNSVGKKGFSLTYKRVAIVDTSPDPPTTPLPQQSEIDAVYLTVYVAGKTESEFQASKTLAEFKLSVSQMAIEYCKTEKILVSDKIMEENVKLRYLTQCPYSWPERDTCMKVQFAVPINVTENSTLSEYQLSSNHLDRMWYSIGNKYLENYGMFIYSQTGDNSSLRLWIIILCSIIVLFSIILYLLKVFGANILNCDFTKGKNIVDSSFGYKNTTTLTMNPYAYSTPTMFSPDNYNSVPYRLPAETDEWDGDDDSRESHT